MKRRVQERQRKARKKGMKRSQGVRRERAAGCWQYLHRTNPGII